jgi:hypothetical protein
VIKPRIIHLVGASVVVALAMAGCAHASPSAGEDVPFVESGGGDVPNPDEPLGPDGELVSGFSSAQLPFAPAVLTSEAPIGTWVAWDPKADPDTAEVAIVYSTADWGSVVILEYATTEKQDARLKWESSLKDTGCTSASPADGEVSREECSYDPYEQVPLTGDLASLQGKDGQISWVQPLTSRNPALDKGYGLFVMVTGTSDALSPDEALAIATELSKQP